ncbi:Hypothetical protein FKW44_002654 [Caligus rogercresseyi]|uniref:Uncharacterized protein n=1 Tax=Caligus rogercresseyi TaxID=217165 RepID=A0A7T8KKI9_CALRO|nr:Hypothetical protein FKW44_002654 [Caligus rogercresseyi]
MPLVVEITQLGFGGVDARAWEGVVSYTLWSSNPVSPSGPSPDRTPQPPLRTATRLFPITGFPPQ